MQELLKGLDQTTILLWIAPGTFITLFRSFSLKGCFPTIGKDDFAALLLGSIIYRFLSLILFNPEQIQNVSQSGIFWLVYILIAPALLGFLLGWFEASDLTGRTLRRAKIQIPTPTPSAWTTTFRNVPINSLLLVTFKDGATLWGRWTGDGLHSAASTDSALLDIFIGEVGRLDQQSRYVPFSHRRGILIAASEIRSVEIITGGPKNE